MRRGNQYLNLSSIFPWQASLYPMHLPKVVQALFRKLKNSLVFIELATHCTITKLFFVSSLGL